MATKEDANRYLMSVADDRVFWVNNGPVFKNIQELADGLKHMNEDAFNYHANSEKNDFSNWVHDVIGDKKLAADLLRCKSAHQAYKKVRNRVESLAEKAR